MLHKIADISENLGRLSVTQEQESNLLLRRINRIRTIQGSLAVEGNTLTEEQIIHIAPPANRVPLLMNDLLNWLKKTNEHPLIMSSVFHYEFEFIHPFTDGNGRLGRLWQALILSQWKSIFKHIPVESMVYAQQDKYYQALNQQILPPLLSLCCPSF